MDVYLRGPGLSSMIGATRAGDYTPRSVREDEEQYYRCFSTPWAVLPAWIAALPGLLHGVSAWVAARRPLAHHVQQKEV